MDPARRRPGRRGRDRGHVRRRLVDPDHRGHRLGTIVKIENLRRARAHEPALAVVETYNAEANPHMLAINVAMGFRPYLAIASFQGSLAEARASVAAA